MSQGLVARIVALKYGTIIKIKKRAECIVELYKQAGFFKNTGEVLDKNEPQANASRTS